MTAALHAPGRGVGRRLSPERSTGGRAVAMPPREPERHRPGTGAAAAAVPPRDLWPLTKRADDDEARPSRMDSGPADPSWPRMDARPADHNLPGPADPNPPGPADLNPPGLADLNPPGLADHNPPGSADLNLPRGHGRAGEGSAYDDYGMAALGFTAHEDMDWLAGRDARAEAEVSAPGDRDGRAVPDESGERSGDFPAVRDTDGSGVLPAVEGRIEHGRADIVPPPARRTRADRRHGDRIDGWVRPEYRDEPATGDYWTPVPDAGYGWPTPVERLPQVPPPVPPAADPGPDPESEPTALVPQLPPMPPPVRQAPPPAWPPHNPGHTGTGRFLPLDARPPLSAFPGAPIPTSPAQSDRGNLPSERGSQQPDRGSLPSERGSQQPDRGNLPSERGSLQPGRGNQRPGRGNAPLDVDGPQQNAPRGNPGGRRGGRSPVRRPDGNARQTRTFAGRAESAEGPIWTVPDLPDAAMPDLSWTPQRDEPRGTRRGPAALARRGRDGERPAPADARTADQRPRPRPSPRPRPGTDPAPAPEPHSNVYVSRHAAEPT